jgi:ERCC4-related helicase
MIEKINEVLQDKQDAVINIVNDKLTISVFSLLEQNLRNVKEINFVIRDTKFVPESSEISHEFEMNPTDFFFNAYDITEKNKLQHFARAKSMHDFIEKHVNVRKVNKGYNIGGNILIIDDDFMIQGSSSLEISNKANSDKVRNINFDTILNGSMDKEQILQCKNMFNQIWYSNDISADYKNDLLESLKFVYKEHAPEFLYYFTINELFGHQIDAGVARFEQDNTSFKKTKIWNMLYDFQKDCVLSAIQKINKYNGCIIADSVGLGKTFEALAVIKYFELRQDNVLVLTPAKLFDNWNSFRGAYKDSVLDEVFNYKIMFHTDLTRYKGESKSGFDLKRFDWSKFDLVVIDESHNFRNRNEKYDENEQLVMNRYTRLMQDVIKRGNNNTKVLLLSATPVNNSLVDLKNQISIITADKDFTFEDDGINSVENLLRRSSTVINQWEKAGHKSKEMLLDSLPSDFYRLLEMMTIARSRKHITNYYGDAKLGKFPDKNKPITLNPEIDSEHKLLKFKEANELLEQLNLSVYTPIQYVDSKFIKIYLEKYQIKGKRGSNMTFNIQESGMKVLHRFNLFKRLESSVYSFAETIRRLIDRIDRTIEIVESGGSVEEFDEYDETDEDNFLEGKYQIDVNHLRKEDFLNDLAYDKFYLEKVYTEARQILDNDRDEKIKTLEIQISNKISNTPYNGGNRKLLIFTAFADTANYIYDQINKELLKVGIYTACISGSKIKVNNGKVDTAFNDVLCAFSPMSKMKKSIPENEQVHILIGTDCISEGQNLQDCDTVINYDIQWNPVSLIQRFGRIDRIGSTNTNIQMINFFPNVDLNEYLGLEARVKGKMTALNIVSTGDEDFLSPEMNDFNFRKRQLEKLKDEVVDIDDTNENISLTDLNMNEYLYELSDYVKRVPETKKVPKGVYSVTEGEKQGVLFCFKHRKLLEKPKSDSSLYPYYLIYIDYDGTIFYGNTHAREVLKVFRKLCYKKGEIKKELFEIFAKKTKHSNDMSIYSMLLNKAVKSIKGEEESKAAQMIFDFGGYNNSFANETSDDFELVSFLAVE